MEAFIIHERSEICFGTIGSPHIVAGGRVRAKGIDRGNQPLAKLLLAVGSPLAVKSRYGSSAAVPGLRLPYFALNHSGRFPAASCNICAFATQQILLRGESRTHAPEYPFRPRAKLLFGRSQPVGFEDIKPCGPRGILGFDNKRESGAR
jgi:hypothetical protein